MDCKEAREYYSEYLEDGSEEIQTAVKEHLSACPHCREQVRNLGSLIRMVGKLPDVEPASNFLAAVNGKIDRFEQRSFFSRLLESFSVQSAWPRAVAVAATLALVVMATFYAGEKVRIDKLAEAGNIAAEASNPVGDKDDVKETVVSSTPPVEEVVMRTAFGRDTGPRRISLPSAPVNTGNLLRNVGYGSSEPVSVGSSDRAVREEGAVSGSSAALHIGAIPPPSRSKAAYPDRIVVIRANETQDATEQVRGLVKSLEGEYLIYGPEITFAKVPIELNDHLMQAMESLGEVTEFEGPIDRSSEAQHFLIEVVILPELP